MIRSRHTCSPPAPVAMCRCARRMRSSRTPSTISPRASRSSSRACRTARRSRRGRPGRRRLVARWPVGVLDIGCGTGLCGPLLRPYASRFVGVDLSGGMLDHSRGKERLYRSVQSELTEFLLHQHHAFDVIVSADTLVYFGDLLAVLHRRRRRAAPIRAVRVHRRTLVAQDGFDFRLELHGRYSHSDEYVRGALEA